MTGTLHEDSYTRTYLVISRTIILRIFATLRTRARTFETAVPEMWHKSWCIIYTVKFDKANFDCSQRRDSFQQGIWSLAKSSARLHCIVSGQCVAANSEVLQRSHLARPWHSASSEVPLWWQWNYALSKDKRQQNRQCT